MINAIRISEKDNVVVCVQKLNKGDKLSYDDLNGKIVEITVQDDVPAYHKVAIQPIKKGENVLKYGEHIGIASCDIEVGKHVHLQNVSDHRENLENKE